MSPARPPGRLRCAGRQQPHVLVVEDDPQALGYVRGILQDAGYCPLVTGEPEQVPSLIETHRPDLVLLDLLLPGTDGIELMQRLRRWRICRSSSCPATAGTRPSPVPCRSERPITSSSRFTHRAGGPNPRGAAQAGRTARAFPGGRPRHQLRGAPSDSGRPHAATDHHRVRATVRPVSQRRPRIDSRSAAAPRVALTQFRQPPASACLHQEAPPQARRRCRQPYLYLHRAPGRVPLVKPDSN